MSGVKLVSYNVYGTLDNNKYIDKRLTYIVDEIFKNGIPDIICLQEATHLVIDAVHKKIPNYYKFSKIEAMILSQTSEEYLNTMLIDGYLIIFSKWNFVSKELLSIGSHPSDGIIRVVLNTQKELGFFLTLFNVHLPGGSFARPEHELIAKEKGRIEHLTQLNVMTSNTKEAIIAGDFNYDSNNKNAIEYNMSIEYIQRCTVDVWTLLKGFLTTGATEDEIVNTFRSAIKIKPKNDKKVARYDKIIYKGMNLSPVSIDIIGNQPIPQVVPIDGKDSLGDKYITHAHLFPSDHFGLVSNFIRAD